MTRTPWGRAPYSDIKNLMNSVVSLVRRAASLA